MAQTCTLTVHKLLANGAQLEARANQVRLTSTIASALVIFTLKMIAYTTSAQSLRARLSHSAKLYTTSYFCI